MLRFIELLEARIAPAGVFKWNVNASGNWDNPANWALISGILGVGYPDSPDDMAVFTTTITADRVVTIPDGVTITVGQLDFDDNHAFTIAAAGTGHLVLAGASSVQVTVTDLIGDAAHSITAPVEVDKPLFISITNTSPLTMSGVISDDGSSHGITKSGTGTLVFSGTSANVFTGGVTVQNGTLQLSKSDGLAAVSGGFLQIGDGIGAAGSAKVVLGANGQVQSSSDVFVTGEGLFDLANHSQTVFILDLFGTATSSASVTTGASGSLGVLIIDSQFVAGATGPSISGVIDFGFAQGQINVVDGDPASDLTISAVIKGTNGFIKKGAGVLALTTSSAQLYTGTTDISEGVLLLNTNTGDAGISNSIQIDSAGTLRLVNTFEVPDNSTVNVAGGTIEIASGGEDWTTLNFTAGGHLSIAPGAFFNFRPNGSVSVAAGAHGALIDGGGAFNLSGTNVFDIADTLDTADLTVNSPLGPAGLANLVKTGAGTLAINRDTLFTGSMQISGGVVKSDYNFAGSVQLDGGALSYGPGVTVHGVTATLNGGRYEPAGSTTDLGLALSAANTFVMDYNGKQASVIGAVNLAGAALEINASSPASSATPFTLIDNDGADAVTGTFAGLSEGAKVVSPQGNYFISYHGGDGNDVTLTPELLAPTITNKGLTATFTDYDGDLVTVKTTKGTFAPTNFILTGAGVGARLTRLTLTTGGFDGANVTITATPRNGAGDRHVDVNNLYASGVDLAGFSVPGDLGSFTVGNGASNPNLGLGSLVADSIGLQLASGLIPSGGITGPLGSMKIKGDVRGLILTVNPGTAKDGSIFIGGAFTPALDPSNASLGSAGRITVNGDLGALTIRGDLVGGVASSGFINVTGALGSLTVGGSIRGGAGDDAGEIRVGGAVGKITLGHDLVGGAGLAAGSLKITGKAATVTVGGSLLGGAGQSSGTLIAGSIDMLTVRGDLRGDSGTFSGAVSSTTLKKAMVGGSIVRAGGDAFFARTIGSIMVAHDFVGIAGGRAGIAVLGKSNPTTVADALALGSITVLGQVANADIIAGALEDQIAVVNADVQIGKVAVTGAWTNSRIIAGVISTDSVFGNADDKIFNGGGSATINARIASIIIGGTVRGSSASGDGSGFVAQDIGSLSIAGTKLPLKPAPFTDNFTLGAYGDVFVREVPAM